MLQPKMYLVDAFADRKFAGNPAAVCLLPEEKSADWMQSIASEVNLSDTAFVQQTSDGFHLRWFTPADEVDLCGHATLAAAHVLWSEGLVRAGQRIQFSTKSGELTCSMNAAVIEVEFPSTPASECEPPGGLLTALGCSPSLVGSSMYDLLVVLESEQLVRSLTPDFSMLKQVSTRGVIVTSVADDSKYDFVSRFFAPQFGIDEDPVTGSAHCCLGPFWSDRLGRQELVAFQASERGGEVKIRINGNRVVLGGNAVTVFKGELC